MFFVVVVLDVDNLFDSHLSFFLYSHFLFPDYDNSPTDGRETECQVELHP